MVLRHDLERSGINDPRFAESPDLSATRLLDELRSAGNSGGYCRVWD